MMPTATTGTTAAIVQRNKIIRRFKQAGATAPDRAIDPATHRIRQSLVFNQLEKEGVIVKVRAHHYYINEALAAQYHEQRLQVFSVVLIVIAIAVVVYLFVQWL
jgi:hypothetical protein